MKNNEVSSEQNAKKKKFITVLAIYLSESKSVKEVLLVKDVSSENGFHLPGGKVVLQGGPKKQRKREIYKAKLFTYEQSGFNTMALEPIDTRSCAFYSLKGELFKVYCLTINQKPPSQYWKRSSTFKERLVNISKILLGQSNAKIEYQTEIILKDFFKKRTRKNKKLRHSHLIPVRELQAVAS
jgi:hypothetical protein